MTTEVLMYDGVNSDAATIARDFPHAAKVAGYIDGPYAWSPAQWRLFPPPCDHVTIATSARVNAGDVLDVEAGDATPDQCEGWIAMRKQAGLFIPTVYCNYSTIPAVRTGTGKWILGKDYDLWVAKWDGNGTLPYPLAVAKQDESTADYDVNVVYDTAWPHRHPQAPPPPPASALKVELEKWLAQGVALVGKMS